MSSNLIYLGFKPLLKVYTLPVSYQ